jgi:hypothetical protein
MAACNAILIQYTSPEESVKTSRSERGQRSHKTPPLSSQMCKDRVAFLYCPQLSSQASTFTLGTLETNMVPIHVLVTLGSDDLFWWVSLRCPHPTPAPSPSGVQVTVGFHNPVVTQSSLRTAYCPLFPLVWFFPTSSGLTSRTGGQLPHWVRTGMTGQLDT